MGACFLSFADRCKRKTPNSRTTGWNLDGRRQERRANDDSLPRQLIESSLDLGAGRALAFFFFLFCRNRWVRQRRTRPLHRPGRGYVAYRRYILIEEAIQ